MGSPLQQNVVSLFALLRARLSRDGSKIIQAGISGIPPTQRRLGRQRNTASEESPQTHTEHLGAGQQQSSRASRAEVGEPRRDAAVRGEASVTAVTDDLFLLVSKEWRPWSPGVGVHRLKEGSARLLVQ